MTNKQGGKRLNSGRKPKEYPTTQLRITVRTEWLNEIKELIKSRVKELELKNNN